MWSLARFATVPPRQSTRRSCRFRFDILEGRIVPATFQVVNVAELQAAIAAVNTNPTEQATIKLAPGTYDLTSALQIMNASELTIKGSKADEVTIDNPTHTDMIFDIRGGNVTLDGLTITGGHAEGSGGIMALGTISIVQCEITNNSSHSDGGGIRASGTISISQSLISDNYATIDGGGISAIGTLVVSQSSISGNSSAHGGGIWAVDILKVDHSVISGNGAVDFGGGIYAGYTTITVNHSTISGNTIGNGSGEGGGICASSSTMVVNHSTISDNSTRFGLSPIGGGIRASGGALTVNQSTISDNSARFGGGIYVSGGSLLTVDHSSVSGNMADQGGGIYVTGGSQVEIGHSTIIDFDGGGIYCDGGTVHLKKSVVDGTSYLDGFLGR